MVVSWACKQYPFELRYHAAREAELKGEVHWNTGLSHDARWAIDPSTREELDISTLSIPS